MSGRGDECCEFRDGGRWEVGYGYGASVVEAPGSLRAAYCNCWREAGRLAGVCLRREDRRSSHTDCGGALWLVRSSGGCGLTPESGAVDIPAGHVHLTPSSGSEAYPRYEYNVQC